MRDDSEIEGGVHADVPRGRRRADGAAATDAPGERGAAAGSAGTMIITFKLYATLQDLLPAGAVKNAVPIEVATDVTLNEIIDRHRVPRELAHLVLVNGVFVLPTTTGTSAVRLKPSDVLAIWPPVAGG